MHFLFTISCLPGKHLITADALYIYRGPITSFPESEEELHKSVDMYVWAIVITLPATDKRIKWLQRNQTEDEVCQHLITICTEGWPNKNRILGILKPYYQVASELSVVDGLLLRGFQIEIPSSLHLEVLDQIYAGHQGIQKCRQRASQSVWWPGLLKQLEELVKNCRECCKHQNQRAEPLIPSKMPELPWQKVGSHFLSGINPHIYLLLTIILIIEYAKL